jgi:signal peptidase complex subunit 2
MTWFTTDGFFVAKPFQQWLATEIPVIGAVDPASIAQGKGGKKILQGKK